MIDASEDDLTFEAAYERLQDVVESMENGQLSLDENLKLFEEGIGLVRRCTDLLDSAELRITTLTAELEAELIKRHNAAPQAPVNEE